MSVTIGKIILMSLNLYKSRFDYSTLPKYKKRVILSDLFYKGESSRFTFQKLLIKCELDANAYNFKTIIIFNSGFFTKGLAHFYSKKIYRNYEN